MSMKSKVFGIGMFKTGTKSLGKALRMLGYAPVKDRPWFVLKDNRGNFDNFAKDRKNWPKFFDAVKATANVHQGFADAPWLFLYKELSEWYPDAKFVLTVRESAAKVVRSEHWQWRNKKERPSDRQFAERYENHNAAVKQFFADKPGRLLIMCFERGDGWRQLCRFLGKPIVNGKFPHEHKSRFR